METLLIILAIALGLIGIVGSIVPGLPGPPFSWLAIQILYVIGVGDFSGAFVWWTFAAMVVVTVLDFLIPGYFTKITGGSRAASWGAVIGLFVGMFVPIFPPFSMIVASFLGALVFELIFAGRGGAEAIRSAMGAFIGFIFSTGLKLVLSGIYFYYILRAVF